MQSANSESPALEPAVLETLPCQENSVKTETHCEQPIEEGQEPVSQEPLLLNDPRCTCTPIETQQCEQVTEESKEYIIMEEVQDELQEEELKMLDIECTYKRKIAELQFEVFFLKKKKQQPFPI